MYNQSFMRLFVYEHLTGGGLLPDTRSSDRLQPLAAEGQAMCAAIADDFAKIDGAQVTYLRDARSTLGPPCRGRSIAVSTAAEYDAEFNCAAASAEWTLVIAPETGGALAERCRRVAALGGRLLGGSPRLIELASDKQLTAEHLSRAGVPTPYGIPFLLGQSWPADFPYPAIWKPRDGAGSLGLRLIADSKTPLPVADGCSGRLEEWHPATTAASVAFLCGPAGQTSLPPCSQRFGGNLHYLGGALPLSPLLAERATRLARRAVVTLPEPLGYLGVDLMLGERDDGHDDIVIEINPRLTTSYLGLRATCRQNLAAAMLAIAQGEPYALSFHDRPIEFSADGETK
jgi:tyramine---L-glutamate ligase